VTGSLAVPSLPERSSRKSAPRHYRILRKGLNSRSRRDPDLVQEPERNTTPDVIGMALKGELLEAAEIA